MINRELIRLKVVQLIYAYYQNPGKTMDVALKELNFSLSKAHELYQYLLGFLINIRQYAEKKEGMRAARAERLGTKIGSNSPDSRLAENQFLRQLDENEALNAFREHHAEWDDEELYVKKIYTLFVESEIFQMYMDKENFDYEADRELIRKLYKTYVCNNDELVDFLEEHSLYWNDDKDVVDSFVLKTIKRFTPASGEKQEILPEYDTEDDHQFALELFQTTIERGDEMRDLIRNNSKNWEFGRLAFMDVIIMQIALTEMLTFPTIPLNVTFNEYLDIAKIYSTPRSSSYINGLLDHVVKYLQAEKLLLK